MMSHLSYERDAILRDSEVSCCKKKHFVFSCFGMSFKCKHVLMIPFFPFKNKNRRTFSPPPSPAVSHNKVMPSAHANKEKIRLLTEEM